MTRLSALAAVLVLSAPSAAPAAIISATYTTAGGDVLAFTFDGTVQPDMDTIIVNNVLGVPTFNGVAPSAPNPAFDSWTNFLGGSSLPPTLSFSGAQLDFIYFNNFSTDGFLFDSSGIFTGGTPVYSSGPSYGNTFEPFDPQNWSVRQLDAAVPEPATLGVLGVLAGIGGLVARRRKTA